jgi:hypothetical protein
MYKEYTKEDRAKYANEVKHMSNTDLLEEVYSLANCTACEEWSYAEYYQEPIAKQELERRLKLLGFL